MRVSLFYYTTHTGTYTCTDSDVGTINLNTKAGGVEHNYRDVNTTNVYNKGKSDGTSIDYIIVGTINIGSTSAAVRIIKKGTNKPTYVDKTSSNLKTTPYETNLATISYGTGTNYKYIITLKANCYVNDVYQSSGYSYSYSYSTPRCEVIIKA